MAFVRFHPNVLRDTKHRHKNCVIFNTNQNENKNPSTSCNARQFIVATLVCDGRTRPVLVSLSFVIFRQLTPHHWTRSERHSRKPQLRNLPCNKAKRSCWSMQWFGDVRAFHRDTSALHRRVPRQRVCMPQDNVTPNKANKNPRSANRTL